MEKVIRIGIIGIGNMGAQHALKIVAGEVPGLKLTAVADRRADRRAWIAEQLPADLDVYEDSEDLIDQANLDAVLIATPHWQHPELTIRALERGLHVLCEKPEAVTVSQARRMNEAADRTGKVFALMFNQRTNPLYRRMKDIMDSGELGELKRSIWIITTWYRTQAYYDSGSWRATWAGEGGGVLLNQCPHNLDLWQWICGMPVRVHAYCHEGKWHDIEVEDDVTAYVEYPNGATGVFITSTADTPGTNRLEIICDKGKMVVENDRLTLWRLDQSERVFRRDDTSGFGQPQATAEEVGIEGENPQHLGVLRAFAAHLIDGSPLIADGREGIHSLTLSNAMYLSGWIGGPVSLPLDETEFDRFMRDKVATSRHKEVAEKTVNIQGTYR